MKKTRIIVKGIVKYNDKYMIVKKWYDDRINEPYQWEFIDGYVDMGDSPDDMVVQLIQDQTMLNVKDKKILYTWTYQVGDTGYVGLAYLCDTESDIVILSEEFSEYLWIELDEFEKYITNKNLLNDVLKSLRG